jgi:hypothetical protein
MESYWKRWSENEGNNWNMILSYVHEVSVGWFNQLSKELSKPSCVIDTHWDIPNVIFEFSPNRLSGTAHNIQVLTIDKNPKKYLLQFACSAWHDIETPESKTPRIRYWCHSNSRWEQLHSVDVNLNHIDEYFKHQNDTMEQINLKSNGLKNQIVTNISACYHFSQIWNFDRDKMNWDAEEAKIEKPVEID